MANNKIVYGDQTLIDLTSDTVTPETLAMGETAHSASGAQIVGTMSPSGPTTILTPSNASPPAIVDGTAYTADGDGYAIESYWNITPNNDNPVALTKEKMYRAMKNNGYAIQSYENVTPTTLGTYVSTSGFKKLSSSGYVYSQVPGFDSAHKTLLWENPDLSTGGAKTNFANQTITTAYTIRNYEGLCLKWKWMYTTDWTEQFPIYLHTIYFINKTKKGDNPCVFFGLWYTSSSPQRFYTRGMVYVDDTHIQFTSCWNLKISASATNSAANSRVIPCYIYGVNFH